MDKMDRSWSRATITVIVVLMGLVWIAAGAFLVVWLFQVALLPLSPVGVVLMLVLPYLLAQQMDNLWLKPRLLGRELRLHAGLIFVGLMGALSGVLGALIVIPSMATAKIVGRYGLSQDPRPAPMAPSGGRRL